MQLTKDPLRLILGGILLILGILILIGIGIPGASQVFTVVGVITGFLLLFKTRYV